MITIVKRRVWRWRRRRAVRAVSCLLCGAQAAGCEFCARKLA